MTLALFLLVLQQEPAALSHLPVLRASSRTLDVQDGHTLWKGIWSIDPTLALDTYDAHRSTGPKSITFLSDLDSLAFDVEPGKAYDFVIELDGKRCPTRVSTARQAYRRPPSSRGPDRIPFRLVNGRIHVEARVNGSEPLDLLFDTGADNLVLHPSAVAKGAQLRFDGAMENAGLGGTATRATSRDNRLEVAGLTWPSELVLFIEKQGDDSDGILGYVAFEDRVLEIDYGRSVLVVHDELPQAASSFTRSRLRYEGTIPAIEVSFRVETATETGWFVLDTGATAALHLNLAFATQHDLLARLETIGTSESRGVGPGVLRNRIVLLPELRFGPDTLAHVPTHVEAPGQDKSFSSGCLLGMDVLRRFDAFVDFPNDALYLRPNAQFGEPFADFGGPPVVVVAGGLLALVALALAVRFMARRARTVAD